MKAQAATEYLVQIGVVLVIALFVIGILAFPLESTQDAKKKQTDLQFKINAVEYPDLLDGLIGYWKFEDASGTSAQNNRGGTSVSFGSGNSSRMPSWTQAGKSGYALVFDGTDDYVSAGSTYNANESITIAAWIKPMSAQRNTVVDKGTQYWLELVNSNVLTYRYWGATSGGWRSFTTVSTVPLGEWSHVAVVNSPSWSAPKIYINGAEATISTQSQEPNIGSGTFYIGGYSGSNYNFNGTIDEVMVFSRALSAGEIRLLYENPGYPQ